MAANNDGGGAAGRCLSDLPDDMLRHILFFAPARDGAATAVLSRRWRWLWRTSGAVNLDSRSFVGGCSSREEERDAFFRGAEEALAGAAGLGCPIKRLTFSIAERSNIDLMRDAEYEEHNLLEAMVSNPAARRVEELQIDVQNRYQRYTLTVGSLPSEALRVLRLTNCSVLTAPEPQPGAAAAAFPTLLVDLHLQNCSVSVVDFQDIVDVAPRLSTLHLESSTLSVDPDDDDDDDKVAISMGRLLLPAVTTLVVADCEVCCRFRGQTSLELDVPRLQYFRYRGSIHKNKSMSLKPPPPPPQVPSHMIQVDLELSYDYHYSNFSRAPPAPASNLFWQFIQNFSTTKILKLKLDDSSLTMDDVALVEKASHQDELLGGLSFHLLEQLQLEAKYKYGPGHGLEKSSMVMLADLLHRCPVVRDLQLRFGKQYMRRRWIESSIDKEAVLHFDKSVNGFRNRRTKSSMVSLLGAAQNNDVNYEDFGIPAGLTGEHSFSCLQSHLKRVSLHFFMEEPDCLELQLAKFFAENAMVLEEMHIDDGSQEMQEHVNSVIGRWSAITN